MTSIFLNYRSGDVPFAAALMFSELSYRFGEPNIFLDGRSVPAGSDFRVTLREAVRSSTVLLVLVGPLWTSPDNLVLLGDEQDWVRQEILEAWEHDVPVIPVLVEREQRIDAAELPSDLRQLANLQYLILRHYHAHRDVADIVTHLTDQYPSLAELRRPSDTVAELPPSRRKDMDALLKRILPPPQQWVGNRRLLAEVALSILSPDEELQTLAPCHFSRAIPGSAVVLVTRTSLIVADLGDRARVTNSIRLPRTAIRAVALLPRRRLGVPTADVDVHLVDDDVITIRGLLRSSAEYVTDLLGTSA